MVLGDFSAAIAKELSVGLLLQLLRDVKRTLGAPRTPLAFPSPQQLWHAISNQLHTS